MSNTKYKSYDQTEIPIRTCLALAIKQYLWCDTVTIFPATLCGNNCIYVPHDKSLSWHKNLLPISQLHVFCYSDEIDYRFIYNNNPSPGVRAVSLRGGK